MIIGYRYRSHSLGGKLVWSTEPPHSSDASEIEEIHGECEEGANSTAAGVVETSEMGEAPVLEKATPGR